MMVLAEKNHSLLEGEDDYVPTQQHPKVDKNENVYGKSDAYCLYFHKN